MVKNTKFGGTLKRNEPRELELILKDRMRRREADYTRKLQRFEYIATRNAIVVAALKKRGELLAELQGLDVERTNKIAQAVWPINEIQLEIKRLDLQVIVNRILHVNNEIADQNTIITNYMTHIIALMNDANFTIPNNIYLTTDYNIVRNLIILMNNWLAVIQQSMDADQQFIQQTMAGVGRIVDYKFRPPRGWPPQY